MNHDNCLNFFLSSSGIEKREHIKRLGKCMNRRLHCSAPEWPSILHYASVENNNADLYWCRKMSMLYEGFAMVLAYSKISKNINKFSFLSPIINPFETLDVFYNLILSLRPVFVRSVLFSSFPSPQQQFAISFPMISSPKTKKFNKETFLFFVFMTYFPCSLPKTHQFQDLKPQSRNQIPFCSLTPSG